jgi:membrane-associated progesterone receptor component
MAFIRADYVLYAIVLAFPIAALFNHLTDKDTESERSSSAPEKESNNNSSQEEKKSAPTIMQPERPDLPPPKDDPFTQEELRAFDGSDPNKPIYIAIKGAPRCALPCRH